MSKTSALLSVTLLAMAACVTEAPAELDRPGDQQIDMDEVEDPQPDFGGRRDRLPVEAHPGSLDPAAPDPTAMTFPAQGPCVLVTATQASAIAEAARRAIILVDRDLAEGEPGSIALAHEARAALAEALAHAEVARDTLLDGPLSLDGDATTTSDAEGAMVRGEQHAVVTALSRAVDLSVERAYARNKADRGGVSVRQAAVLAGKALGSAHDLRSRAIECELGVWR